MEGNYKEGYHFELTTCSIHLEQKDLSKKTPKLIELSGPDTEAFLTYISRNSPDVLDFFKSQNQEFILDEVLSIYYNQFAINAIAALREQYRNEEENHITLPENTDNSRAVLETLWKHVRYKKAEDSNMKRSVLDLDLSTRLSNCLRRAKINTIEDLCNKTIDEVAVIRNLGRKSLDELLTTMNEHGLHFKKSENY